MDAERYRRIRALVHPRRGPPPPRRAVPLRAARRRRLDDRAPADAARRGEGRIGGPSARVLTHDGPRGLPPFLPRRRTAIEVLTRPTSRRRRRGETAPGEQRDVALCARIDSILPRASGGDRGASP